jgi:hypothetical protein
MCRLCLVIIFGFLLCEAFAQKQFCGELDYQVEYLDLPSDMEGMSSILPNKCHIITDGKNWRLDQNTSINGAFIEIYHHRKDSLYQFLTVAEERVRIEKKVEFGVEDLRCLSSTGESTISGISVQKRSISGSEIYAQEMWVSKEFQGIPALFIPGLDALPIQFEVKRQGVHMRYTLVRLTQQPLDDTYFTLPTNYKPISEKVYQSWLR